jgi:hypothetical protein
VSSINGTLFYIKSGQLLFKKECDVQARNKKKQKQYIVLLIILTHKNRIKREAMRKAGEPLNTMRT